MQNWAKSFIVVLLKAGIFINLFLFVCAGLGCRQNARPAKKKLLDTLVKGSFKEQSGIKFDSIAIDTFLATRTQFAEFEADFQKLYQLNNYNYVWYDKKGLIEPAISMVSQIQSQVDEGIYKPVPYQAECQKLIEKYSRETNKNVPDLQVELMLTAQYFNYAKNNWGGASTEKTEDIGWYLPKKKLSYLSLLHNTLQLGQFTDSLAVIPQYTQMLNALIRFKKHRDSTRKDTLVVFSKKLGRAKLGDTLQGLLPLKIRLYQLGDLPQKPENATYDTTLLNAVNQFKSRLGMQKGYRLTSALVKSLNVSTQKRIEQVLVNLERMRWMPVGKHADEFILVNIPEFKLHYFKQDSDAWDCKVVVGKALTKTVIFRGEMQYVVFSPYWNVPQSILEKEIRPALARNSNYLVAHNMEWYDGKVRQKPGKTNSLGLVKFIFPNSNNIYLHDTPSKSLFNEDNRAFSHGCIRVGDPLGLALKVLSKQPQWTAEKIERAMHAGVERTVVLKQKIPVDIAYFTAFVGQDGLLNFREDIYQRDARLLELLMKEPVQ